MTKQELIKKWERESEYKNRGDDPLIVAMSKIERLIYQQCALELQLSMETEKNS